MRYHAKLFQQKTNVAHMHSHTYQSYHKIMILSMEFTQIYFFKKNNLFSKKLLTNQIFCDIVLTVPSELPRSS